MKLIGKLNSRDKLHGMLTPQPGLQGKLNTPECLSGILNKPNYAADLQYEIDELSDRVDNLHVEDLVDGNEYATKEYVDTHAGGAYFAGNGLKLSDDKVFSLDDLIIDCGTSTDVIY